MGHAALHQELGPHSLTQVNASGWVQVECDKTTAILMMNRTLQLEKEERTSYWFDWHRKKIISINKRLNNPPPFAPAVEMQGGGPANWDQHKMFPCTEGGEMYSITNHWLQSLPPELSYKSPRNPLTLTDVLQKTDLLIILWYCSPLNWSARTRNNTLTQIWNKIIYNSNRRFIFSWIGSLLNFEAK